MQPGGPETQSKLPVQQTFCQEYTRGAQIFHTCSSHLKTWGARWVTWTRFRTRDPPMLGAAVKSLVAPAIWRAVIVRPPCLPWELFTCVTYFALPHCNHLDIGRYVVSLLLFSAREPTGPAEPCVSGCFFLPAFRNYTSQQLAVHLRWIFLQGPLLYWSVLCSAQMFLLRTLCGQQCVRYVVAGPMAEMCFCCESKGRGRDWRK